MEKEKMVELKREQKYLVVKWDDICTFLTRLESQELQRMLERIELGRRVFYGKFPQKYVVVNEEESYSEQVWALVERSEIDKLITIIDSGKDVVNEKTSED